jgi:hypothetical protein
LLPGGAIQFPGGFISRCGPVPFTAHCNRLISSFGKRSLRFFRKCFSSFLPAILTPRL